MPVFHCLSCQRLLYRPEELSGRAWQCPECGPTVVSDEAVAVSPELAALLEQEYHVFVTSPPPRPSTAPGTPPPAARKVVLVGKDPITRAFLTVLVFALVLWGLLVALGVYLSMNPVEAALAAGGGVCSLWVISSLTVLLVCKLLDVLRRTRTDADDSTPRPCPVAGPAGRHYSVTQGESTPRLKRWVGRGSAVAIVAVFVLALLGAALEQQWLVDLGILVGLLFLGVTFLCALLGIMVHALVALWRRRLMKAIDSHPDAARTVTRADLAPGPDGRPEPDQFTQGRSDVREG
jgi:hypothetical protein